MCDMTHFRRRWCSSILGGVWGMGCNACVCVRFLVFCLRVCLFCLHGCVFKGWVLASAHVCVFALCVFHVWSALQRVAVCCSELQCVAVCCSVLQCATVCCSVLQHAAVCCSVLRCVAVCCSVLQCAAVCCSVLQCAAVCCSVLQCVASPMHIVHNYACTSRHMLLLVIGD